MAKKELRIYFNLDNENEKELYEHLMKRTSASGYLKDIALDVMDGKLIRATKSNDNEIVEQLKNINNTLSNLSISTSSNHQEGSTSPNIKEVNNGMDFSNMDIDFSDIDLGE